MKSTWNLPQHRQAVAQLKKESEKSSKFVENRKSFDKPKINNQNHKHITYSSGI